MLLLEEMLLLMLVGWEIVLVVESELLDFVLLMVGRVLLFELVMVVMVVVVFRMFELYCE